MTHARSIKPLVLIRGHLLVICSQFVSLEDYSCWDKGLSTNILEHTLLILSYRHWIRYVSFYPILYTDLIDVVCTSTPPHLSAEEGCSWRKYPTRNLFNTITKDPWYCMINTRTLILKMSIQIFDLFPAHAYVSILIHQAELSPF